MINLDELFTIYANEDAKRFEFNSKINGVTSYTIGFHEANNLDDAKISIFLALKKDYPKIFTK